MFLVSHHRQWTKQDRRDLSARALRLTYYTYIIYYSLYIIMRLSNAWILAFATLSSSISAFQLSSIATTTTKRSIVSNNNNIQATKTEELEDLYKVSSTPTTTNTNTNAADESHHTNGDSSMTYADINKLAYRALQKQCKTLDLIAVGTTSTLRGRLLDYYNLSRETNDIVVDVPKATAEEIEVRILYVCALCVFRVRGFCFLTNRHFCMLIICSITLTYI